MNGTQPALQAPGLLGGCCPACLESQVDLRFALDFIPDFPPGMRLVRCTTCGTDRIDPRPAARRMAAHYDGAYYAEGYLPFLEARRQAFRRRLRELEAAAPVRLARGAGRAPSCLDVGAGVGLFVLEAAACGWQAQGLEPSSAARILARQRFNLELAADWTAGSQTHDVITLWDVLGHVEDPRELLGEIRARLVPGGVLVLKVPNFQSAWHRVRTTMSRRRQANLLHAPTVIWRFHRAGVRRLLAECGFSVTRLRTVREPDLLPLTPRWRLVRAACNLADALTANRQEMILHAVRN